MPPGNHPSLDPKDYLLPRKSDLPAKASASADASRDRVPPIALAVEQEGPTRHKPTPVGPTVGIIIILVLLIMGALYFWGARLNRQNSNNPPFIPADNSTTTVR